MVNMKRVMLTMLALILCLSFTVPAFAAETKVDLFGTEAAADGSRFKNTDDGWLGYKFKVTGGKLVGVVVPSWYDAPSSTVLVLYKWNKDYSTSMQSSALYSGVIEDNGSGWVDPGQKDFNVKFERAFAEGDYLLVIQRKENRPLHVPTKSAFNGATAFVEGVEYANVSFQISALIDANAQLNETPNLKYELGEFKKPLYGSGGSTDGKSNIMINEYDLIGHSFTVSGGSFIGFLVSEIGVESTGKVKFNLYKWNNDYATSKAGTPVFSGEYNCQKQETGFKDLEIRFGKALPQGKYLVTMTTEDNIFIWTHAPKSGVTSYLDGTAYAEGTLKFAFIADPSAEPVEEEPGTNPATGDNVAYISLMTVFAIALLVTLRKKVRI